MGGCSIETVVAVLLFAFGYSIVSHFNAFTLCGFSTSKWKEYLILNRFVMMRTVNNIMERTS